MHDSSGHGPPQWNTGPSAKAKNAVQRSVTSLLDALAPERVLTRLAVQGPVEQHRTPTGCVLQASNCAVSVSWFAVPSEGAPLGELHVLVWRGKVTRRGAPRSSKKAELLAQLVLRPVDPPAEECVWRSSEGDQYQTASLAARCLQLLEERILAGGSPDAAPPLAAGES